MSTKNSRCFDTKNNKLKAFIAGSFLGAVVAVFLFLKFFILPFKEVDHSFFILYIGFPLVLFSAFFGGLKLFLGAANTRIVVMEKEMTITIGKKTQSFKTEDFVDFLPVNEYGYFDSYKFMVFKNSADNDVSSFSLPGMTDEHYSYVLLCDVSNRQYRKMMTWLNSVLKDLNIEKNKTDLAECQPMSYEKLMEEYSKIVKK